ncbi:MFS transporter [Clostridium sp. ZBS2]|uniref:CynX/NimT family MFS transporter n=1 Tax=Clostridium sp. ZBS2 TaxID=2949976 RepID=UPI0020794429|nr:MFS transporter [Clostridium sp. ZBS2]
MKKSTKIFLILGIIFISFNLRAPITSVGSIINLIKAQFNLSNSIAGFITTVPLIIFAIFSPFVSKINSKLGYGKTMMGGLAFIFIGELIRSYTNALGLFLGTAIIGIGIAIGNVLIPSIIKLKFSKNTGVITSVYTTSMCILAAVGSGISVPLVNKFNLSWRNSLCIWSILTLITVFIWIPQLKNNNQVKMSNNNTENKQNSSIWKSPLAWWVTLFMGIQSLIFYCLVAWLPSIILSKGMSSEFAGTMSFLFQLVGLPATLLFPIIADKFKNQRGIATLSSAIYFVGMIFLMVFKSTSLIIISLIFVGIGMGGSISLAIAFIALRSPNDKKATELSGMAQSAGYAFAAIGPFMLGFIFDFTSSWMIPLIILNFCILLLIGCGLKCGKNEVVDDFLEDLTVEKC